MEEKVSYFAYGANRDPRMMAAITGNQSLIGIPAVLEGYQLCIQRLDQIPDIVFPTSPAPISPRDLLKQSWPETFESYIIKPKKGSKVHGNLYKLTPQERELVRDWELIDFGWYKDEKGIAVTSDGKKVDVVTEGLRQDQEVDREVLGEDYNPWLNSPEDFERVAEKSRREFFERMGITTEGSVRKE